MVYMNGLLIDVFTMAAAQHKIKKVDIKVI
jgi:hypothetical protein